MGSRALGATASHRKAFSRPLLPPLPRFPPQGSGIPSPSQGTLISQPCTLAALPGVCPASSVLQSRLDNPNTTVSPGVGMGRELGDRARPGNESLSQAQGCGLRGVSGSSRKPRGLKEGGVSERPGTWAWD